MLFRQHNGDTPSSCKTYFSDKNTDADLRITSWQGKDPCEFDTALFREYEQRLVWTRLPSVRSFSI